MGLLLEMISDIDKLDKYNNSFIVSRLSGFLLSLSVEVGVKDSPKRNQEVVCEPETHW